MTESSTFVWKKGLKFRVGETVFVEYCKNILNESMRSKIPEWDSLSPVDPMKVFADGVLGSLIETEKVSFQRTQRLLNLIPTFFGFCPRQAEAPFGYFEWIPSETLKATWILPRESPIQYELNDEIWDVVSFEETPIQPIRIEGQESNSLNLRILRSCTNVVLSFLPSVKKSHEFLEWDSYPEFKLKRWNPHQETFEAVPVDQFRISYSQLQWNRLVRMEIQPRQGKNGLFEEEDSLFQLYFEFGGQPQPTGTFYVNIVQAKIIQHRYGAELGYLNGIPWEEKVLSKEMIEIPQELEVLYPSGEKVLLKRLISEILQIHVEDPSLLLERFIYDPVRHSILFPSAFLLIRQYHGGVSVHAGQHAVFPPQDWIPKGAKLVFSGFFGRIEAVRPIELKSPRVHHESPQDYMSRFYAQMRKWMSQDQDSGVVYSKNPNWKEIEIDLLGQSSLIHSVEIIVERDSRAIKVYVMDESHIKSLNRAVDPEVVQILDRRLRSLLPIEFHWKIRPYIQVPIQVVVQFELACKRQRLEEIQGELIEVWIHSHLSPLFSPKKITSELSLGKLQNEIVESLKNNAKQSELPKVNEIEAIRSWCFAPQTGEVIPIMERKPGTCFDPIFRVDVQLAQKGRVLAPERSVI